MSAEIAGLVDASLRGDRRAFGKIVERYQSAVSGMAYSVTGDLSLSEDLAQETFVIAWRKLGDLQKRESLAPWLCGIARNLARSWVRTHAKNATVSLDNVSEAAQPSVASAEETRLREERSETVWTALAQIPENYREPLVLFYRQDHSIRDIAEALELTEDCVKQRLSRGRKLLRAEVTRMVEDTLEESRPGKAFTAGVLAALPPLHAPAPPASAPAGTTTTTALQWLAGHPLATLCALGVIVLGGLWGARELLMRDGGNHVAPQAIADSGLNLPEPAAATSSSQEQPPVAAVATDAETSGMVQAAASVSGEVVFVDTSEPAPGMRVILGAEDGTRQSAATDEQGHFAFADLAAGTYVLVAFDAGFEDVPEDWLRSEHQLVTLAEGAAPDDVRIQVPPQGGRVSGRVFDRSTNAPLEGFTIGASRERSSMYEGTSNTEGRYSIIGLPEGEWRVYISTGSPLFTLRSTSKMTTVPVPAGGNATLDIPIDLGVSISGRVVDLEGNPVAEAIIDGNLFSEQDNGPKDGGFRTKADGSFTIWGAGPGDRAVLAARKDELASPIAVVNPVPTEDVTGVLLTLQPKLAISGRFVDERGAPIAAHFWRRPVHEDGAGEWRGWPTAGTTFEETLAPGVYEVKGRLDGHNQSIEQPVQRVTLAGTGLSGVTIRVATQGELTGAFTLSGILVDESARPLPERRVYIQGVRFEDASLQETYTGRQGRFRFEGLRDTTYTVAANPSPPYETFAGNMTINPAEVSEVRIVARLAATLRGRVSDAQTGEPVPHFTVGYGTTENGSRARYQTQRYSSSDGTFTLPALLDKTWSVQVTAAGYVPATEDGPALSSGEVVGPLEFKLSPSRRVRGLVADPEGSPVAGALVFLDDRAYENLMIIRREAVAETDAQGSFLLTSLPADADTLYVRKDKSAVAEVPIAEEVHVVLTSGGAIEGELRINGVPYPGASVFAHYGDRPSTYGVADEAGAYSIDRLRDGVYRMSVFLGRTHPVKSVGLEGEVVVVDGVVTLRDIALSMGDATLSGRISHNGAPVAGISLRCIRPGYWSTGSTDEEGRYTFPYLPAGPVTISACDDPSGMSDTWVWRPILETEVAGSGESVRDIVLDALP